MSQPSSYAAVDDVIDRWVKASGSALFTQWANEPARFFYVPGLWDFECFQVSISPPTPESVTVSAWSVDTNDGQEMESHWSGAPAELDTLMALAMAEIERWKNRSLTNPVSYWPDAH